MVTERSKCCVSKCRRSVVVAFFYAERTEADGWGRVISYANHALFICPLHMEQLRETGKIEVKP